MRALAPEGSVTLLRSFIFEIATNLLIRISARLQPCHPEPVKHAGFIPEALPACFLLIINACRRPTPPAEILDSNPRFVLLLSRSPTLARITFRATLKSH